MNRRIGVFPGSFDPFTAGHEEVVRKALTLFDQIIVVVGVNPAKSSFFAVEQKIKLIETLFEKEENVEVALFEGLMVDFCQNVGANHLVRGLRNTTDYSAEREMGLCNMEIAGIETVFFSASPKYAHVSSSLVRELMRRNVKRANLFAPSQIDYRDYFL